ncbi:MAG: RDD family protein [Candidatus Dojkabacteria bacterium]
MLIRRLLARYIDNILILVLSILIGVAALDISRAITTEKIASNISVASFLIGFVLLYTIDYVILTKKSGQSIGKKVLRIKLINDDKSEIKYTTIFFRELVLQIISIASGLGLILLLIPYFAKEHRLLHDFIFKTNVIKKQESKQEQRKP